MRAFLALLLWITPAPVRAELAVVVHLRNSVAVLSPRQIQDIFLGRTRTFPNGHLAFPLDQSSPLRASFYQGLTGRPIEQIDAYWARLIFTGQASPPLRVPDDAAVLRAVRENEGVIGYVDGTRVDRSVRVLLLLQP